MGHAVRYQSFDLPRTGTHRLFALAGGFPGGAAVGGVCTRTRTRPGHVGVESRVRRWFAGRLPHFGFAIPFAQLDTLVAAIFWGAVRFVLVDKHSYIQVMSFSFSLLTCRCCV